MKYRIPKRNKDLRRYVLRRRAFQITAFVLWIAAFLTGILSYNASYAYNPGRQLAPWKVVAWTLGAAAIGFALFRIWKLFTDCTFSGVIEESGLSADYTSSRDPGAANPVNYDFRLHTALRVRTQKGKLKRINCEQKPGFYLYYYQGTYLCHLAGLPYPICDPTRRRAPEGRHLEGAEDPFDDLSGGYMCAACGFLSKALDEPCPRCFHSLIDPSELFGTAPAGTDKAAAEAENKERNHA